MQPMPSPPMKEVTLDIVGSNTFGRNPKISVSQTFNMFVSDGWLQTMPGYKLAKQLLGRGNGRGLFKSSNGNFMIAVVDNAVYKITGPAHNIQAQQLAMIDTYFGDVSMDENLGYQIGICDGVNVYIYDWRANTFATATLPVNSQTELPIVPGYITYHDSYFHVPDTTPGSGFWYLSSPNNGLIWNWGAGDTYVAGRISSKPDTCVAVVRAPGKGNMIYVLGQTVTEMWYDNGQQGFPYQRTNSVSIDYGCLSSTTIGSMDNYIAFLGINDNSGPVIMVSEGAGFEHLSTDGIDLKLEQIQYPAQSYAFFYKIAGHTFYQITFYNKADNVSLVYDFNEHKFYYATDQNMNFHIAEVVAFYENSYFFVSLVDGNLYEMSALYSTYDYTLGTPSDNSDLSNQVYEIPYVRFTGPARMEDGSRFICNNITFTIDQGNDVYYQPKRIGLIATQSGQYLTTQVPPGYVGEGLVTQQTENYVPRIEIALSYDGGRTFSSFNDVQYNPLGDRRNRVIFWKLGISNDFVFQIRFHTRSTVTVSNGILDIRGMEGAEGAA
jgi:hypothetical protein